MCVRTQACVYVCVCEGDGDSSEVKGGGGGAEEVVGVSSVWSRIFVPADIGSDANFQQRRGGDTCFGESSGISLVCNHSGWSFFLEGVPITGVMTDSFATQPFLL